MYAVHDGDGDLVRSVDIPVFSTATLNAAFSGLTSAKGTPFTFSDASQNTFTRKSETFSFRLDSMIQATDTSRLNAALARTFRTVNIGM